MVATAGSDDEFFFTKTFESSSGTRSIVLQNTNGPCALVAIANVLALRDTPMAACVANANKSGITEETLKSKLGEIASQMNANAENIESLFEFMPKLSKGLDVNPKFNGQFAASPELGLFEAFRIPLVHTWVLGADERAELGITDEEMSNLSYEEACTLQFGDEPNPSLGQFLALYPSQMTTTGVLQLQKMLPEATPVVMFWNNHFSTVIKHKQRLFSLVTDLGFQRKRNLVWEEIDARGAGKFVDGEFLDSDRQEKADELLAQELANADQQKLKSSHVHSGSYTKNQIQDRGKRQAQNGAKTSQIEQNGSSQQPQLPFNEKNESKEAPKDRTKKKKCTIS